MKKYDEFVNEYFSDISTIDFELGATTKTNYSELPGFYTDGGDSVVVDELEVGDDVYNDTREKYTVVNIIDNKPILAKGEPIVIENDHMNY